MASILGVKRSVLRSMTMRAFHEHHVCTRMFARPPPVPASVGAFIGTAQVRYAISAAWQQGLRPY